MNNLFNAVVSKFENDIIDELVYEKKFENEGKNQFQDKVTFFLEKDLNVNDLEDEQRDFIFDRYFNEFQKNAFEEWWRDNGQEYQEEFVKNNKNTDDVVCYAYDEWCEKNYLEVENDFAEQFDLKLYLEFVLSHNTSNDRFSFELHKYYSSYWVNGDLFKDVKYVEIEEVHLNHMTKIINKAFGFADDFDSSHDTDINDYKISKIAFKIAKEICHK